MKLLRKYSKRELLTVLTIWVVLCGLALGAVATISAYGVHVVSYIETVKGGRAQRVSALLLSAQRRAAEAVELSNDLNKGQEKPVLLPAGSPIAKQALDLYEKAETLDLGDLYRPEWSPHYVALAHIHASLGDEAQQARYLIRSAIAQQDYELAKRYIEQVLSRMPNDPKTLLLSAELSSRKLDKSGMQLAGVA